MSIFLHSQGICNAKAKPLSREVYQRRDFPPSLFLLFIWNFIVKSCDKLKVCMCVNFLGIVLLTGYICWVEMGVGGWWHGLNKLQYKQGLCKDPFSCKRLYRKGTITISALQTTDKEFWNLPIGDFSFLFLKLRTSRCQDPDVRWQVLESNTKQIQKLAHEEIILQFTKTVYIPSWKPTGTYKV